MAQRSKNTHHFIPVSRFQVKKPPSLHRAYHDLFKNRTGWEAIELLQKWSQSYGVIREDFLAKRSEQFRIAFKKIFGNEREIKALVRIIRQDWIPPGVRMIFNHAEMEEAVQRRNDLLGLLPTEDD